ncbi:leucine-rich repeat domain-containing protein [Cyanobacteria bacterium FACHB-471]|nr:leucine-rich repeat domain-containing protein [Cyanobacteria bacterium FACHB-471]
MTQEELLQVIEQAARDGRRTLDLAGEGLTALPPEIGKLTQLKHLILGKWYYNHEERRGEYIGNNLKALPPEIGQLINLKKLWASANQLSNLPAEIGQLTSLRSLKLDENQLSSLPAEITQLTNLRSLSLSDNQLSSLPAEIGKLINLQSLDLTGNQLINLPVEIVQLASLRSLHLTGTELSSLPAQFGQLTSLRSLDLIFNQLSSLPAEIGKLINLQSLDLTGNQLINLPVEIVQLASLRSLHLGFNQLTSLPAEIVQLINLQSLDLRENQLTSLPAEIVQLINLRSLNLSNNQLSSLPVEIKQIPQLTRLELQGNPLPIPPEILGSSRNSLGKPTNTLKSYFHVQDSDETEALCRVKFLILGEGGVGKTSLERRIADEAEAYEQTKSIDILRFYFQVQKPEETELIYEAKLLILGEGGVGKTSLAKKIADEAHELQDENTTQGIDVIRWQFELPNGQHFRVNIWDFGGQEIYHQTHQFFLTERSLYLLVADTRKENTDFYYWLSVVELLSNNSPILIIKNEKQNRRCEINDRQFRGEFNNLKETLATNLADNRGLQEIKDAIQLYISRLPHMGTRLPKVWAKVRSVLESYTRNNYISLDEYYRLCRLDGLTDQQEMLSLIRYLHDIGVCLHFHTDPLLKKTVILKPEWGTAAVYKVLDNETVINNLGYFTQDELADIWSNAEYADMRDELLHLMMRFKLCYEIPGRPHTYIAPNLLSVNQPDYDWDETDNLSLRYEYEFMPKGILTRLIVEMHPWIEQQLVWKNGVVLHKDQTRAEVIEHYNQREIRIRVTGSRKKELLAVVTYELAKIHQSYERLQYQTLVPCNCERKCKNSQTPYSYPLETLHEFLDDQAYLIQCQKSRQMVDVRRLIDDVLSQEIETEQKHLLRPDRPPTPAESLQQELEQAREKSLNRQSRQTSMTEASRNQVFVSYSHQDQNWLKQLQTHLKPMIRNQTLDVWDDTRIQPGAEWRKDIETALSAAKVAVLLVSPDFLASDFIADQELPPLLNAAEQEGLTVFWIPISYSSYEETEIAKYQSAHPPQKPLDSLSPPDLNFALVNICKKLKAAFVGT